MLKLLLGYFLLSMVAFAEECNIAKNVDDFRTTTVVVDDVTFHLHFPKDKPWFTNKVIQVLKKDIPNANRYFNSRPLTEVHLVTEAAAQSNGLATVFPYNIITLYDYPPIGNNYLAGTKEWIRNLVVHEYIHIITMDMSSGWINYLRYIFGSAVKVNGLIPRWLNEGAAVWYESLNPGQGRLNQPGIKYQVYKALSDDRFCKGIDCLDVPLKYPYGHAPYWIGGEFVRYLEQLNPGFVACVFQTHSRFAPFFLNTIFKQCIGMDVHKSYKQFKEFYLKTNSYYSKFCPVNKSFCEGLRNNKVDETKIDFEAGVCEKKDYLLFAVREEEGRGRYNLRYKFRLLNKQSGYSTDFVSTYPVVRLDQENGKCILKQSISKGCEGAALFSELLIPELQTKTVYEGGALKVLNVSKKTPTTVNYNDGLWTFSDGDRKKEVRSENLPDHRPGELSYVSEVEVDKTEAYSGLQYLSPEFFLFDYSNFANLSAINLNTRLNDPINAHTLSISVTDYISTKSENFWGGSLFYAYQKNNKRISADYFRSYFVNSFTNKVASSDGAGASLRYFSAFDSWKYNTYYSLRYSRREDFISRREGNSLTFGQSFNQTDNHLFRTQRSLYLNYSVGGFSVESTEEEQFLTADLHIGQSFHSAENSFYGYKTSHGRYFKDDLKGGYLAAGGVNNYFANGYPFPLYMVSFADLIGNELTTFSSYYNGRLSNFYNGFGMLPLFIKDSRFEAGAEYAKAKFFLTPERIYKDEYLAGLYFKYTLNTKLFYLWDSSISFAWAQLQYPEKQNRIFFLFDAAAF